jgi:hypothetical protein
MDGAAGEVRVTRLVDAPPPLTLVLCTAHADRLVVPRGWVLHDARDEGRLFAAPGEGGTAAATEDGASSSSLTETNSAASGDPTPARPKRAPRRKPRKAAGADTAALADAAASADAARAAVPAVPVEPAEETGAAPAVVAPALFGPDAPAPGEPPPHDEAAPATAPADDLTRAPVEHRLLHRAFRAATTRDEPGENPDQG